MFCGRSKRKVFFNSSKNGSIIYEFFKNKEYSASIAPHINKYDLLWFLKYLDICYGWIDLCSAYIGIRISHGSLMDTNVWIQAVYCSLWICALTEQRLLLPQRIMQPNRPWLGFRQPVLKQCQLGIFPKFWWPYEKFGQNALEWMWEVENEAGLFIRVHRTWNGSCYGWIPTVLMPRNGLLLTWIFQWQKTLIKKRIQAIKYIRGKKRTLN